MSVDTDRKVALTNEKVIGNGSFGVVFQATLVETGETVAVKKVLQDKRFKVRTWRAYQLVESGGEISDNEGRQGDSSFGWMKANQRSFKCTTGADVWFWQPDEVYLNLVLEFVPETIYRIIKHYSRTKRQVPSLYVKVRSVASPDHPQQSYTTELLFPVTLAAAWLRCATSSFSQLPRIFRCSPPPSRPFLTSLTGRLQLYMYQVARSLAYIHQLGICHRDIKPQNLLLDPNAHVVKLCDFGSAKMLVPTPPPPPLLLPSSFFSSSPPLLLLSCGAGRRLCGEGG
eukprot:2044858-Rhodomonas_salina.2